MGTEDYNIFHTVSFIESNATQNLSPRKLRFHDPNNISGDLHRLYQLFGPKTKVSVDFYSCSVMDAPHLLREFFQREGSSYRWALNGMRHDDVAIIVDSDETFSVGLLHAEVSLLLTFACDMTYV